MLELFQLLSDSNRYKMFVMLYHDEYCVCDIMRFLSMKQANVSKHIKRFKDLSLVTVRHDGKWVHYTLSLTARKELHDLINYMAQSPLYQELTTLLLSFEKNQCIK